MSNLAITYDDVKAAAERIRSGNVVNTPAEYSHVLSDVTGAEIFLKFETFQFTSSFKERGGLNCLLSLSDDERKNGVIAVSAGNHAQSVAYHSTRLGIPATIVMPKDTPFTKVKRTEELGAEVVLIGETFQDAAVHARGLQSERGLTLVHTFDDPHVMAGHGTLAIEFLDKYPDLEILVVPIGGGGLIAGIAVAAKAINPNIKIYGVQSEVYPSMKYALEGKSIHPATQTIAEGIAIKEPGMLTREVVRELVDDILIVSEKSIERAINCYAEKEKVVVEGAGAASLAAVSEFPELFESKKTGLIVSGANIDPRILAYSLMRGLAQDGRISRLKVTTPDLPGGLAKLTNIIAEGGGNVMEVYHQRQFAPIPLKYTEINVVVETKDIHHRNRLVKALEDAGFNVEVKGGAANEPLN